MSIAAEPSATVARHPLPRLVLAGLLTGIVDGLFSSILAVAVYDSTATRMFQVVASTVLGRAALEGGTTTAALGLLMHFGVAFGWSAVFLVVVARVPWVRRVLASSHGVIKIAALYGPAVWLVMSLVVIPLLVHRPPRLGNPWLVQLLGHFPFVGLPIVAVLGRPIARRGAERVPA